ncbi:MAG: MFS transporter [Burkholderiales bacterium]|nr:MFS transporter [Burkholderiales bacterium]
MVVPGTLNDLAESLQISIALAGQLFAVGAATVCFGAPLLAGWVSGFDRRKLLAFSLLGYALGHALCAAMPSYAALLPLRAVTMLGAAVFTPQAGAAVGFMSPPEHRGRAIAFIFVGWSLASVLGLPMANWVGETFGWRYAFSAIAALSLLAAAWVYVAMPNGVRPPAVSFAAWKHAFATPSLMGIVAVTFLFGAGQFTLFAYFTPYFRDVLHATTAQSSLLLICFGVFGVIGNIALARFIDRIGAHAAATAMVCLMVASFAAWPLASSVLGVGLAIAPWAFGCFSSNSAQQARLSAAAPALASALLALNTSAIYLGQAVGASSGGWLVAHRGYGALSYAGLGWLVACVAVSVWATRAAKQAVA